MKRFRIFASLALLLLLTLGGSAARADLLQLTLSNPIQTGAPGTDVDFYAVIYSPDDFIFLNGDNFGVDGPITLDDSGLFANFNQLWFQGDYLSGVLFTLTLPANIHPGTYAGSFTLLGGYGFYDGDPIASVNFNLNIPGTFSPVPEPSSLLLIGTGLLAGAVKSKRKWINP